MWNDQIEKRLKSLSLNKFHSPFVRYYTAGSSSSSYDIDQSNEQAYLSRGLMNMLGDPTGMGSYSYTSAMPYAMYQPGSGYPRAPESLAYGGQRVLGQTPLEQQVPQMGMMGAQQMPGIMGAMGQAISPAIAAAQPGGMMQAFEPLRQSYAARAS